MELSPAHPMVLIQSGRYRIRTRVLGLEIRGDIQATLIALGSAGTPILHEHYTLSTSGVSEG